MLDANVWQSVKGRDSPLLTNIYFYTFDVEMRKIGLVMGTAIAMSYTPIGYASQEKYFPATGLFPYRESVFPC